MKKSWLLVALTLSLGACGFHLRGSYDVPPFLAHLDVMTPPNSALRPELLLALQTAGIDTAQGEYKLNVVRELLTKQTTTVDSRAKAAEYTLVYDVQYRLQYASGRAATQTRNLLLRRSYQYDTRNIVGKSTEEETLVSELRADAVQQIVRQVSALREDRLLPDTDPGSEPATVTPAATPAPAPAPEAGQATP